MKPGDIVNAIFPVIANKSANDTIRERIENSIKEDKEKTQTPLRSSSNPELITKEKLERLYEDTLKRKDNFEDKAKATIVCVTVSVSLILGASGLLTAVSSRFDYPLFRWTSYILFLYAVLSMITAAVMDIKVIANENIIYTMPPDCPEESIRDTYDKCVGQNMDQNLIRNNYVFTAYECIRNALICLFIIMALSVFPIHMPSTETHNTSIGNQRIYSYSEFTLDVLSKYSTAEIQGVIEKALPSMQTEDGQFYSIADKSNRLFIKFQVNGSDINVLSIETISWEQ